MGVPKIMLGDESVMFWHPAAFIMEPRQLGFFFFFSTGGEVWHTGLT